LSGHFFLVAIQGHLGLEGFLGFVALLSCGDELTLEVFHVGLGFLETSPAQVALHFFGDVGVIEDGEGEGVFIAAGIPAEAVEDLELDVGLGRVGMNPVDGVGGVAQRAHGLVEGIGPDGLASLGGDEDLLSRRGHHRVWPVVGEVAYCSAIGSFKGEPVPGCWSWFRE